MKAAVLHAVGAIPTYEDFPDPVAGDGEVVIHVRAVALENVDKAIAAGTHYAANRFVARLPAIMGFDGVGALDDGTVVGFGLPRAPYGAMAERTVVSRDHLVPVPDGISPELAVVLGTAVTGFAMQTAAGLKPGETVLIQGATGVAGRLAVQVARLLGAGRIVGTGRHPDALIEVTKLGADAVVDTAVDDDELVKAFARAAPDGYDVVLDFLWGRPTEVFIGTLIPPDFAFAKPTRLVQIGEAAGPAITLAAESLRTSGLEIYGAAKGMSAETMSDAYARIVEWSREGKLRFDIVRMPLREIETAWQRSDVPGKRIVVIP